MLKWVGNTKGMLGLPGIPGRDLSPKEVEKYGKKVLLASGLYEEVKVKKEIKSNG